MTRKVLFRLRRQRLGVRMLVAALVSTVMVAGAAANEAPAFKPPTFADDTLMYVFGPKYRNPFTTTPSQPDGADVSRNNIEFKHVDAWKYGHNVVEIILKKSSDVAPAAGGVPGRWGSTRSSASAPASTGSPGGGWSPSVRCGTSTSSSG